MVCKKYSKADFVISTGQIFNL